ncbi:TIGR00341 family protein [Erythrobacter sp. HKB08]|uniref:TIGR00341 family protein n=1 Tax=Erythrobacter sp. HKB08 TaxID=2502843 RepID=UPI0010086DC2|nr:TIGR00341 family protein [Erythrobacter sp. HKB08]
MISTDQPAAPTTVAPNRWAFLRVVVSLRLWWRESVIGTVDQPAVIEKRREECLLSARYLFMTAMSGGIAILGLLLSSPAVVIGAMLLSPLMGPIIGLGFALAVGDYHWLRQAAVSLAYGSIMAIALCALIVFFSPLQTVTEEIASRTRPNLFDLLVAIFSALAGAYAMIRGREGTIVGVAIATALMPPLAVVGFGLATFNWTVFSGALLLYITNLLAIALTSWAMARFYGFRSTLSERQTQFQNFSVIAVFIALAIPLGFSLRSIAWEANAQRIIRSEVMDPFDGRARMSDFQIAWESEPIGVSATVLTPVLIENAESQIAYDLEEQLGRPVSLILTQYQVGTSASAAEQAQLAAARAQEEAAAARADELAERVALIGGVEPKDVIVDRQRRRVMVRARALPGASLATYAELERRISATEPDWQVNLVPPVARIPAFSYDGEEFTEAEETALTLAAWASARNGMGLRVIGRGDDLEKVRAALAEKGATDIVVVDQRGPVRLEWVAPDGS